MKIFTGILLVVILLAIFPNAHAMQQPIASQEIEATSANLTSNLLDFLINQSINNWTDIRESTNNSLYYGLNGLAGIGMQMITSYNLTEDASVQTKLNKIATAIADYLYAHALVSNSTDLYWPVHEKNTTLVDLGYSFGLSGIATFYSTLAQLQQNSTYTEYASRILSSLVDFAETNATDIFWTTTLDDIYFDATWLQVPEIPYYLFDTVTFLGKSYGVTGLADAVLKYLTAPSANQTLGEDILTKAMHFQNAYIQEDGATAYLPITVEYPNLIDFSEGFGLAGVGNLMLDVATYKNDTNYTETALKIIHYLNTTSNGAPYYFYTRINSVLDIHNYEMGVSYGIAGTLNFMLNYYLLTNDTDVAIAARKLVQYIDIFKSSAGAGIAFPERVKNSKMVNTDSTSYAYGTAGIVLTLQHANQYINVSSAAEDYTRGKNYIKSATTDVVGYSLVKNPNLNYMDFSVELGATGMLPTLLTTSSAILQFSSTDLDFSTVEIGTIATKSVDVTNLGEQSVIISISNISTPFTTNFSPTILDGNEKITISFSAISTNETQFEGFAIIAMDNIAVAVVTLKINLYDNPLIQLSSPQNNSELSGTVSLQFVVNDASSIKSIVVSLFDAEHKTLTSTAVSVANQMLELDTSQYANGTYYVKVDATDIFDHISTQKFTFTFANSAPNPLNIINFDYLMYGTIAAIVVVVTIIIYRMKKYR